MTRFGAIIAAILFFPSGYALAQTCKEKCASQPGACLEVADFETPETDNPLRGLALLYEKLRDTETTEIPQNEMLALFKLPVDPCARSSTVIEPIASESGITFSYRITNTGGICRIGGTIVLPSGRTLGAHLLMPPALYANLTQAEDEILINQPIEAHPVPIVFSINSFMEEFGGAITYVEFLESEAFVETQNGCIWLRYSK